MLHFTYKITRPETSEYYFGKHSTDNLEDNYLGSGNWMKEIIREDLDVQKEVISFYKTSDEAYEAEKKLVGELWKTDPLCKNKKPGGKQSFFEPDTYSHFCLEKHGVRHHMLLDEFKNHPNLPFKRQDVQSKLDKTLRKKYGGRGSGSTIIKQKVEASNIKNHGKKHTLHLEHVKQAREQACVEKYGIDNPFKSTEFQASLINPMSVPEYRAKHKRSMENKDWTERNAKSKQTKLAKYGTTNPASLPEIREKNSHVCPFCIKKYDAGNFTNHMTKVHTWTKDKIKEYKGERKKNTD